MCGRYTMHHSTEQIAMRFGVQEQLAQTTERYNIAPTQSVPVVIENEGTRFLDALKWGLIPSWAKDPGIANKMINARAETLSEKPSFKVSLSRRRCLIPSDGFYEWRREGTARQPMHIRRKDGELFSFAGLWEEWKQADGTPLRTCTIITVAPNDVMEPIHNRMPAMLLPENEADWLDVAHKKSADVINFLRPYPAEYMEAYPVAKRVNIPTIEDPALLNSL